MAGLPNLAPPRLQVNLRHRSSSAASSATINRNASGNDLSRVSTRGSQPTGTIALATDLRMTETASPSRNICTVWPALSVFKGIAGSKPTRTRFATSAEGAQHVASAVALLTTRGSLRSPTLLGLLDIRW